MIPFFHFEGRAKTENECSTFVEQCLRNFFFFHPFAWVFVCVPFFRRQNKLCLVQFQESWDGEKTISQCFLVKFLLIKRKSSWVFKLNKAYARQSSFRNAFNKWQTVKTPSRRRLVILIKLWLCTQKLKKTISLSTRLGFQIEIIYSLNCDLKLQLSSCLSHLMSKGKSLIKVSLFP